MAVVDSDLGAFGVDDAIALTALLAQSGLFSNKKKEDNVAFRNAANQVIDAYGRDYVTGAPILQLDPVSVERDLSGYLALRNIRLTPSDLRETARPSIISAAVGGSLTPLIFGGLGLAAVALLFLKR